MFANNTFNVVERAVLDELMTSGQVTIPGIAESVNLSTTTVAKHIARMVEEKKLEELGEESAPRKGRRAIVYGVRSDMHFFIGVDIKNAGLDVGIVDFAGKLIDARCYSDFRFENTHENLDEVCNRISRYFEDLGQEMKEKISAIGLSLGGRVDSRTGTSATKYNFEEMQKSSLASILTEYFSLPVFVENDTKALTYADYITYNNTRKNILFVNFSWGIALGMIINGELYYGRQGYSGELGHIHYYDNNIVCHCGKKGCMETEVSGLAIQRKLIERIKMGEASLLSAKVRRGEQITEDDILYATEQEDPLCIELVSETSRELGKQLAGMINLFNPDCIVLGGKFTKVSPAYFQQQVEVAIKQNSLRLLSYDVPVLVTQLGPNYGIIAAGICARKGIFTY